MGIIHSIKNLFTKKSSNPGHNTAFSVDGKVVDRLKDLTELFVNGMETGTSGLRFQPESKSPHQVRRESRLSALVAVDKVEALADKIEDLAEYTFAPSIQDKFEEFHKNNPEVFQKLVAMALQAKANGHDQLSISMFFERLRWFHLIEKGNRRWKIDNNFRSRYSRLIMAEVPALAGFFKTRELY